MEKGWETRGLCGRLDIGMVESSIVEVTRI
jgi:hypothetical protein